MWSYLSHCAWCGREVPTSQGILRCLQNHKRNLEVTRLFHNNVRIVLVFDWGFTSGISNAYIFATRKHNINSYQQNLKIYRGLEGLGIWCLAFSPKACWKHRPFGSFRHTRPIEFTIWWTIRTSFKSSVLRNQMVHIDPLIVNFHYIINTDITWYYNVIFRSSQRRRSISIGSSTLDHVVRPNIIMIPWRNFGKTLGLFVERASGVFFGPMKRSSQIFWVSQDMHLFHFVSIYLLYVILNL